MVLIPILSFAQYVYPQKDISVEGWLVDMVQIDNTYYGLGSVREFKGTPTNKIFKFHNNQVTTYNGKVFAEHDSMFSSPTFPFDLIVSGDTSLLFVNYLINFTSPLDPPKNDSFAVFEIDLNLEKISQRTPYIPENDYSGWVYLDGFCYYVTNIQTNQGFYESIVYKFNGSTWENINFNYPGWISELMVYENQIIAQGSSAGTLNMGLAKLTSTGWQEFSEMKFYNTISMTNFNDTLFLVAREQFNQNDNNYFLYKYIQGNWEKIEDRISGYTPNRVLSTNSGLILINNQTTSPLASDPQVLQYYKGNKLFSIPDTFEYRTYPRYFVDFNECMTNFDHVDFLNKESKGSYNGMKICKNEILTNIPLTKSYTSNQILVRPLFGHVEIKNQASTPDRVFIYNIMGQLIFEADLNPNTTLNLPIKSGFYVWTNKSKVNSGKLLIRN